MKTHELKCEPKHFAPLLFEIKKAEIRKNDRDYKAGDRLLLREYDPKTGKYTCQTLNRKITHVTAGGQHGIQDGYVLLSLRKGK